MEREDNVIQHPASEGRSNPVRERFNRSSRPTDDYEANMRRSQFYVIEGGKQDD